MRSWSISALNQGISEEIGEVFTCIQVEIKFALFSKIGPDAIIFTYPLC